MKIQFALMILAQLLLTAPAFADGAQPYPFKVLGARQVAPCPGFQARVLKVQTLGATRSGGPHGSDEVWAQNQQVQAGWLFRTINARADLEAPIRAFDFASLTYDASFAQAIDPAVRLMEERNVKSSEISACLSRFDLVNVRQNHGEGTVIDYELSYKIYLTFENDSHQRQSLLVEELSGVTTTHSGYYQPYYNFGIGSRAFRMINESWPTLQGRFGQFLAKTPNAFAEANLEAVRAELSFGIGIGNGGN